MKVPKIYFYYSFIYDEVLSGKPVNYQRIKKGRRFAKYFQKYWDKNSYRILATMSKISHLNWKMDKNVCYLSFSAPFSYSAPLTIRIRKEKERMLTILVHELSHNLFVGNGKKIYPFSKIYKKYSREKRNIRIHVPVEALVKLTIEKVYGKNAEKYLKYERWWEVFKKGRRPIEYHRAWEIMMKEGPENILKHVIK